MEWELAQWAVTGESGPCKGPVAGGNVASLGFTVDVAGC